MPDATARFALSYLAPGQAQKELAHNEALARLDLVLSATVESIGRNDPPEAPAPGQCWIVGPAPTGAWAGQAQALAGWTEGGWRFVPPVPGMIAWIPSAGFQARFDETGWTSGVLTAHHLEIGGVQIVGARLPAVPEPAGGAIVDGEARAAISAVIAALSTHGLIAG